MASLLSQEGSYWILSVRDPRITRPGNGAARRRVSSDHATSPGSSAMRKLSRNGLRGSLGWGSVLERTAIPNCNLYNLEGLSAFAVRLPNDNRQCRPTIADSLLSVQDRYN